MAMCGGVIAKRICLRKRFGAERELTCRGLLYQDPDYFYKNLKSFEVEPEALKLVDILWAALANAGITVYYGCLSGKGVHRIEE
jgi:hypothetical protein